MRERPSWVWSVTCAKQSLYMIKNPTLKCCNKYASKTTISSGLICKIYKNIIVPAFWVWFDLHESSRNWTQYSETASLMKLIAAAWFDTTSMMYKEEECQLFMEKWKNTGRGLNQKQVMAWECHEKKRRAES